ncbi:unnamed protein product [Rotaria magnacalcarata]|uniref:Uncharacterized protein n=2 Tax=Rotaria magnacalcarata TaxID=392030 RepID=A0A814VTV9_9BILA|nr:unnamed protein product [Rotaria magnacalcarata]CAF4174012.1 unnamed protein product [Rotaria magnacalcarata]
MKSNLQARDAIEILKKRQPEENIQCNLTFISANEISKVLKEKVLSNSIQTIEFIELEGYNVKEKLRNIQSNSITLEISDSKDQLLEVLTCLDLQYVELYSYDKGKSNHRNIREVVDKITAERKIKEYEKDNTTIRLIDIPIHEIEEITDVPIRKMKKMIEARIHMIEEIIDKCPNATYNISFIRIRNFDRLLKGFNDELVNIHFDELELEPAIKLIRQIRKENLDFSLAYKKLTKGQAERLMKEAPVEQENIEINKVKSLNELFMNESRPHLELSEFSGRGIEYLLEISEKRFIPWRSIATVVTIAAVQMAVGGLLIASGFGATVGLGLITEGAADLFTAYRAYSTRQFSWSDYGKQKAVSLVISAVSMGFSAIKDAGKGIQTFVTGVGEEVLEQAGTKIITDGKAVSQVLVMTGKNLKGLAIKQIGVTIGENALREGLTKVADFSSHFVLEQLKPQISTMIQSKVSDKFSNEPKLLKIVRKMYAIDSFNKQQQFKDKINKSVAEIINPEHNFWRKQWDSIGGPLCKGLLSSSQHVGGPFSMGMRIVGTLHGMYQITFIIDKVHDQLLEKLSQVDQETLSIDQILRSYCGVTKEDTYRIVSLLQKQGILDTNEEFNVENLISTDFSILDMYRDKVVNFLKSLASVEFNDLSEIMKSISDMITEQVFRITESQLISPWSSYGMGELTKAISERVQHHFIVDENQNSDSQNREDREKGESKYNTIVKQIKYNAKDYTIAYSQCEIVYYSQQQPDRSNPGAIDNKTKEYIDGVRNEKPANLSDMMAIATQNDVDIKIVDDVNYQPTDEDQAKGTNIVLYTKGEVDSQGKNTIGHYRLMLGDGTVIDVPSNNNNCGYAVIQKILKDRGVDKSIEDLRNDRAQNIEDNPRESSKVLKAQEWIETRYPQEANRLLIAGGTIDAQKILDDLLLPSRNVIKTKITELRELIEDYNRDSTDENKIKFTTDLKFILQDLGDNENAEVISRSRAARNIFYSSISRRIDDFYRKNQSVFYQCSDSSHRIATEASNLSSSWKNKVHIVNPDIYFSQAHVNANFSSGNTKRLDALVGKKLASKIHNGRVDEQGKVFIRTNGTSVLPVTVFLDEHNRLVAINNRGLLAHELAEQKPNRILFRNPTQTERNRLNRDGMPSRNKPTFDRNN